MAIRLTKAQAIKLAKEVVAEKTAAYSYAAPFGANHCMYQYDDSPSCLVGHVFAKAGVSIQDLRYFDQVGSVVEVAALPDNSALYLTAGATSFLETLQECQDAGDSWSVALKKALEPEFSPSRVANSYHPDFA